VEVLLGCRQDRAAFWPTGHGKLRYCCDLLLFPAPQVISISITWSEEKAPELFGNQGGVSVEKAHLRIGPGVGAEARLRGTRKMNVRLGLNFRFPHRNLFVVNAFCSLPTQWCSSERTHVVFYQKKTRRYHRACFPICTKEHPNAIAHIVISEAPKLAIAAITWAWRCQVQRLASRS